MSEKASNMSVLSEASEYVRVLALPELRGKPALRRVQMQLPKWSYRRIKSVFYAEDRTRIDPEEMDELRSKAARIIHEQTRQNEAARDAASLRNEISELRSRLLTLESRLCSTDEDFHSPQIDAYRASTDGLGDPRNT